MNSIYEQRIKNKIQELSLLILTSHLDISFDEDTHILFVKGTLTFVDESKLEFTEKISSFGHRYRFHYMDKNKHLIARWDNVPHYPNLANFPHHKHTLQGIESSSDLNLIEILEEIKELIKIF